MRSQVFEQNVHVQPAVSFLTMHVLEHGGLVSLNMSFTWASTCKVRVQVYA